MNLTQKTVHQNLRILVVDDHMIIRNIVSQSLYDLNFEHIELASTGTSALKEIQKKYEENNPYHIVFLDWSMPEMSGLEVLQRIRKNQNHDKTAFIMLTAKNEEKDVLEAMQTGATSYMVKPTNKEQLKKHINQTIQWLNKKKGYNASPNTLSKTTSQSQIEDTCPITEEVCSQLKPVVMTEMKNIFSNLFNVKVIPDRDIESLGDRKMVCIGNLHQEGINIALRFVFGQDLLKPLLMQFYSNEYLDSDHVYEDTACEIVNILCNQVKSYLNSHGFQLEFNLPEMGLKGNDSESITVMNVAFSLKGNDHFYVDIQTD